ncbi:MAG: ABC transporter permease, partial [Ferruginibacter sp.]
MRKSIYIFSSSLLQTMQEFKANKLRTTLSLIGIAFGIFCIIGVLATVNSLERNIQTEMKSLGTNTIYIDKWEYAGGHDRPMWKYMARPTAKYEEAQMVKQRSYLLEDISFLMQNRATISHKNDVLQNAIIWGVTPAQEVLQP